MSEASCRGRCIVRYLGPGEHVSNRHRLAEQPLLVFVQVLQRELLDVGHLQLLAAAAAEK